MHILASLLLLCLTCVVIIRASLFVDDVSFVTAHPDDDVSVIWTLTKSMSMGDIYRVSIPEMLYCLNYHILPGITSLEPITCDEADRGELIVIPREAHGNSSVAVKTIGFRIRNVTVNDAKAYQMTVVLATKQDKELSSTGVIYVFQQPKTPEISLSMDSIHWRNKTVVCSSESRSLPQEYRHMVEMNYEWSLDILQPMADPEGDSSNRTVQSTAIVSCTAREVGSRFVSDAATFDPTSPEGNKPAIILGVVLFIVGIALCSLVGYIWCSGKMNEKLPVTSSSTPPDAPDDTTVVDDTAVTEGETGGQYDALRVRETRPADEQSYERILTNAGRRGITESQLYENVRM